MPERETPANPEKPELPTVGVFPGREIMSDIEAARKATIEEEVGSELVDATEDETTPPPPVLPDDEAAPQAAADDAETGEQEADPAAADKAKPPAGDKATDAKAGEDETHPKDPEPEPAVAADDMVVEYVVDGETKRATVKEMRADYQKADAAAARLTEASERLAAIEAREAALRAREAASGQVPPPEDPAPTDTETPAAPAAPAIDVKEVVEAIQFGTQEDAEKKLQSLIDDAVKGRADAGATPDSDQIAAEVVQTVNLNLEKQRALTTVADQYPDILSDRALSIVATQFFHEMVAEDAQAGRQRSYYDLTVDGAKRAYEWRDGIAAKGTDGNGSDPSADPSKAPQKLEERKQRKRETVTPSNPASAKTAAPPADPPPQKREDIIREMARARGQLV